MDSSLATRILEDCRGAVGEVRFGFGSKRQVWAFEERHVLDASALAAELPPAELLDLSLAFHAEFAAVTNPWRVRERLQELLTQLARSGDLLDRMSGELVDDRLALRHWLVAAFIAGPPLAVFRGLESALLRAYQPQDQWALLLRLRSIAEGHGWSFDADTSRALAVFAQYAPRIEDRLQALDLVARFGGPAASVCLARAARGDPEATVRATAASLHPFQQ